jgi:DNA-binding NarL/FixJ family response regulator
VKQSAGVTTVVLADDQELVRTGLRAILEAEDDIEVVGEAADGAEAVAVVRRLSPHVVLMDIRMPVLDGIEATRRIAADGSTSVVMLTTFDRSRLVYDSLVAGATGFLLKDVPRAQLVAGVRAAARGEELLAPRITRRLIEEFTRAARAEPPPGYDRLTDREREVLVLVARGRSNAEIAAELFVTVETVKTHVARLLSKLGLRDRVQAVVVAYEAGLVRAGEHEGRPVRPGSQD